jgi:alpha-L-rhamnosidase
VEYNMVDRYTFGPDGTGSFRMRFSYHEIQFVTIIGLAQPPAAADVIGHTLTVNLTRTGHFECSSRLLTSIYETTVRNYQGLTQGGMTVDCPHRERRGYGGDGHTSYQFALDNFAVGAYFTKWIRDFADVQEPSGHVPHTAPTVGGGGGPAWSGFIVTLPYQFYSTFGDPSLLKAVYSNMQRQLAFFSNRTLPADGLLHAWST